MMLKNKKFIFGTLTIFSLTSLLFVSNQVQASKSNQQEQIIILANKAEELKSGKFESLEKSTSGNIQLVRQQNGRIYLEFNRNFRTQKGPDVFVVLSRSANLGKTGSSENETYFMVSPLLRVQGEQRYILPGDFDPTEFQSVGIWSRQMNVLFGAANLE